MASIRNSEIVEAKDEHIKLKTSDDDINKLFESMNLKHSKTPPLPFSKNRDVSKKPMNSGDSLKQALRGLCISQAAEMAVIKRSLIPASPRVSDSAKIRSMYRSALVEPGKADQSSVSDGERRIETSDSCSFVSLSSYDPVAKSESPISCSSPSKTGADQPTRRKCKLQFKTRVRIKPVVKTRPFLTKKATKVADKKPKIPVCERCQCSSKKVEKLDTSESSKSSDLSSSTTSLSEESNMSLFNCINKPHMSKDIRWKAIKHVIKECHCLGLRHFSLLKKLGSGDIGTVYLAELLGTSCLFAIKVMDIEFLERRKKMPRARTELEILKMLDHPFLPTLYAQFTSDNLSCLVMEFCPGGDLHVLRQKQPGRHFPEHAARFYIAEVLLALEYLHMLGIVYRDLKPENILVRDDGHIMLTDFDLSLRCSVNPTLIKPSLIRLEPPKVSGQCTGSSCIDPFCNGPTCTVSCFNPRARRIRNDPSLLTRSSLPQLVVEPTEARSNSFVGTHEYLAPEIIRDEGHGSAVDWWTLGVFLYELLYGRTPFKGATNEETLTNVVMQNLRFPDTPIVSFQARDLMRKLMGKEPESRLGTETGAAEIKRHPFFHGLNWALVRSATPPQIPPENGEFVNSGVHKMKTFLEYGDDKQLEFELF